MISNGDEPMFPGQEYYMSESELADVKSRCEQGDAEAAFRLSLFYTFYDNKDSLGDYYNLRAADLGHSKAQYAAAHHSFFRKKDFPSAYFWAEKSAQQGHEKAKKLLANKLPPLDE